MRTIRTVLACLTLAAAAGPAGATPTVLKTEATYAGGAFAGVPACYTTCRLFVQVRAGERYLHVGTSAPAGVVALDVTTANGAVRVCHDTSAGPLPVDGLPLVKVRVVLDDGACGTPAPYGTVTAYFSADPGRRVGGGV